MNLALLICCAVIMAVVLVVALALALFMRTHSRPSSDPLPTPSVSKPKTNGHHLGILVIVALVACVIGAVLHRQSNQTPNATRPAAPIQERWEFQWMLPAGQFDRGLNSDTFQAEITRNEPDVLWFTTPYSYEGGMEVTHYYLKRNGDQFQGSWSQDRPSDSGNLYLKKAGDFLWVGQMVDRAGHSAAVTLKKK